MNTAATDRFNDLFGESGWVASTALDATITQTALDLAEVGDLAAAEDYLVAQISGEMIEAHLKIWFMRLKALARRKPLITLALEDYKAERYHACIPVILSQIDGFVTDWHGTQKGFFTNEIDTGVWDSLAAQDASLITLHRIFTKPRKKTSAEPVSIPYRNGILHGRDLGYANKPVAAKVWAALFAVLDWALQVKTGIPIDWPNPETNNAQSWEPRRLIIGRDIPAHGAPDDYPPAAPERKLVEFLTYWQQRNFGFMALCLPPADQVEPKVLPFRVKTQVGDRVLTDYVLLAVDDQEPRLTTITTRLIFADGVQTEQAFELVKVASDQWAITGWQWL